MAHVCSNTFSSIILRRGSIVFWKMFLLHWLAKLTHQTLYWGKTIAEIFWIQWRHWCWKLKTVSEIAFCFILATGFIQIVTRIWFTETILVPIIIVPLFIIVIAAAVFMILLFLLLLSPRLCWFSSCPYYYWFDCRRYCFHFCSIVVIIASLFCSF